MAGTVGLRHFDPARLRLLLALVFLLLAMPTAALLWQALGQLKWEAWYQYRSQAEELTRGIDRDITAAMAAADARSFGDFAFARPAGDPGANLFERSPLAAWPIVADMPGVIGYFQVGGDGEFSTPLLPADDGDAAAFGLRADELLARAGLARQIQSVLADNRLVRERTGPGRSGVAMSGAATGIEPAGGRDDATDGPVPAASIPFEDDGARVEVAEPAARQQGEARRSNEVYSQQVFDELNAPRRQAPSAAEPAALYGKLEELRLDQDLQKRIDGGEAKTVRPAEALPDAAGIKDDEPGRRRRETTAAPATPAADNVIELESVGRLVIDTFASEIDPYEFSLLDSGHLVLFRKVWRDGERYIQGMLIDRERFIAETIESTFRAASLASMSDLVVGYQEDIIAVLRGREARTYSAGVGELDGSLLFRSRLSAPFDAIELVYSINRLPAGPGAGVLAWTATVLAVVFVVGFYALYRLGLGQIRLARQQQDFVSAVSHELKTPLTSIRMYGEMLKEGWADESRKQQYYEFIHDESERLTRLITNVLQLARITRNEPHFDAKLVAVREFMDTIRSKISNPVERAGYRLVVDIQPGIEDVKIEIDTDCLSQIMINLVDNALKFSKHAEDRRIVIGAAITGRTVRLTVRDFGPGIPKDQLRKIFRLFYRPESELTRETVGTGIGLAIVHQLTTAMGGSVDVVNSEPGAEFRVSFPICD